MTGQQNKIERNEPKQDNALPPADTERLVISRKAQVVRAIDTGVLTEDEACKRYDLTKEELNGWRILISQHGVRGLRITRLRQYR